MKPPCDSWPWILFAFGSLFAGCKDRGAYVNAPSYVPAPPQQAMQPEVVRPGDQISVIVFGEELLSSRAIRVGPRGTVMLPLLGEVTVSGKGPKALAQELEKALGAYVTTPHVTVIIDQSPVVITVVGEARNNGRIEMEAPVRIVDALGQAGGINEFADRSGIYVLRGDRRIRFEYDDIIRGEKYAREFIMMTGDVLVIED